MRLWKVISTQSTLDRIVWVYSLLLNVILVKDVSDLTLSECAVIAGITQNPDRL